MSKCKHEWCYQGEEKMDYHMTEMKYIKRIYYICHKCQQEKYNWNMPKKLVKAFYGGWGHYGY